MCIYTSMRLNEFLRKRRRVEFGDTENVFRHGCSGVFRRATAVVLPGLCKTHVCMCVYMHTKEAGRNSRREKKSIGREIRVKRIPHNVTILSYIIVYKLRFIIHYTWRVIAGPFERYEIGRRRGGQTSQNNNLMAINTRIIRIYGEFPSVGRTTVRCVYANTRRPVILLVDLS